VDSPSIGYAANTTLAYAFAFLRRSARAFDGLGRLMPNDPRRILPFLVRASPLPMALKKWIFE
jgi:hypothetical protein